MTENSSPSELLIPRVLLKEAAKYADTVPQNSKAFTLMNFAESNLWMQSLALLNAHGMPQVTTEVRRWATSSFRLDQDNAQAKALRNGKINRQQCMETNRVAGAAAMLEDLSQNYELLAAFHALDHFVDVDIHDMNALLDTFISEGRRIALTRPTEREPMSNGNEPTPADFASAATSVTAHPPYSVEIKTTSLDPRIKWAEIATMSSKDEILEFGDNIMAGFRSTALRPQLRLVEKKTGIVMGGWDIDNNEVHPDWRDSRSNHVG